MNPSTQEPPSRLRKLGVGVAGALLLLVLGEAGSYLLGRAPARPLPLIANRELGYTEYKVYDHWLFWKMLPHKEVGMVRTNNLGLRGPDVPPDDGTEFRVLSLGESTTFGTWVTYGETYSALLDESLRPGDPPIRVINAGVGGYSLLQGHTYLTRNAQALGIDAVLLYFGHNDFLPVSYLMHRDATAAGSGRVLDDLTLLRERQRLGARWNAWFFDHSNAYRHVSHRLSRPPGTEEERIKTEEAETTYRVPRAHRLELLEGIRSFCDDNGIQLVVVVPWYRDFEEHIPLLRSFCSKYDVTIVDLPERLASLQPRIGNFFKDRVHPGPNGHRLIAREIEEVVRPLWRP